MPPKSHHKGLSLPEVLISTGIMSMVLLGAYALIVFSLRWNSKMSDTMATYQQALQASMRISHDLGTGSQSSFIYHPESGQVSAFAFASARPLNGPFQLDATGQVLWQKYILYEVEDDILFRYELPIDPPQAGPPDTPDFPILKSQITDKGIMVARNLLLVELEPGSGATIVLKVSGEHKEANSEGVPEETNSITLRSRMTFRQ